MKPLISYYGGKQRLASKILPHFPRHSVYVEPFAGGLALLFAKPIPKVSNKHDYREVINDKDERLINLYRVARSQPEEFERMIKLSPYSRADHKLAQNINRGECDGYVPSDIERAWAYYVDINCSFTHNLGGGWGTSVVTDNNANSFLNKRLRLPEVIDRLQSVHIECDDALKVIERWDSPQTLFYLDPPYPNTSQGHYEGYSLDDWCNLCDLLDNISGSYVLSNYEQSYEPKSAQDKVELRAHMSASGKGKTGKGRNKSKATSAKDMSSGGEKGDTVDL